MSDYSILSPKGVKLYDGVFNANCIRKFSLMNEDSLTLAFSLRDAVDFPVGSSVNDFFITKSQVGTWNANTGVWDYQLKFDTYYWAWANKILKYVIPGATTARETSFTLTATIDIHASMLKNSLDSLGLSYNGSPFRIDTTDTSLSAEPKLVSYENLSVLGGIQAIAEAFECEWWVDGNAVCFGKCVNATISDFVFEAGKNVSSISFSQGKTEAPNRLYVFGSDRNLPTNYRQTDGNDTIGGVVNKRLMLPEGIPYLQTEDNLPDSQIVEQVVVLDDVYPKLTLTINEEPETYISEVENNDNTVTQQTFYRIKYGNDFPFLTSYILPNEELHIIFTSGKLNGMDFGAKFNPKGFSEKNTDGSLNPDAQMFEIVANEDYGRMLPDDILKPEKGDTFVLYGWDTTKIADLGLIADAEQELLDEGNKELEELKKDLATCTCPMAWDYMKPLLIENKEPKPGDVVTIVDTAHFGDGGRKSRIIGFEFKLDSDYSSYTYTCGEDVSVSRLKSIENKIEGITKSGTKVQMQNSLDFLSKRYADRTPYQVSSDTGFEVGRHTGDGGGIFAIDKTTGQSYAEVDKLYVRMKAYFESLTIINSASIGGKKYITPGGSVRISEVEEMHDTDGTLTGWKCWYLCEQDGEKTDCFFTEGDQLICEFFNARTGTANKVSNTYYWRKVTAVNTEGGVPPSMTDDTDSDNRYGWFVLSATDRIQGIACDAPAADDVVTQLGYNSGDAAKNAENRDRMSAIVLSTVGTDAPSIKLYSGIDDYSLDGKDMVSFGYDPNTGKAYLHSYGDFRFGSRTDDGSYITFDEGKKEMLAKLKLTLQSTIGDRTFEQYIKEVAPSASEESIRKIVDNIIGSDLEDIQKQIDGAIETWFYNGEPTLNNYPASEWTTEALREQHSGDLYYDNTTGTAYRFSKDASGAWFWNKITDDAITNALAEAEKAYNKADDAYGLADGKMKVFVNQPAPPYSQGDLWVNATYSDASVTYSNDILRCKTARASGSFSISDWELASKYTDDTALTNFITTYKSTIAEIQKQTDRKAETWYQSEDPSTAWTTETLRQEHTGDLWYNTGDNRAYYYNGSGWVESNAPQSVFDAIDGKADIFVDQPTKGYKENDLWFLEKDYTDAFSDSAGGYKQGTLVVAVADMGTAFSFKDWAKKDRYTDAQTVEELMGNYKYLADALKGYSVMDGGLFLTSHIRLGSWNNDASDPKMTQVWSGINGVYTKATDIAAWYGGDPLDLENGETGRTAKTLFRFDGSGYLASGNISWDSYGAIRFGSGIIIDLGGGNTNTLGGLSTTLSTNIALLNNVLNCFEPQDAAGNRVDWNSADIDRIRVKKSFFSDGFISAYGTNSSAVTTGGVDASYLNNLLKDYAKLSDIPDYYDWADIRNAPTFVESVSGMGLSHNDFTDAYKSKLDSLTAYTLPTASSSVKGGIKVGSGLGMTGETMSVSLSESDIPTLSISKISGLQSALDGKQPSGNYLTSVSWGIISGRPTTISGYGITDAYTTSDIDSKVTAINTSISGKVSKSGDTMTGTLAVASGLGIEDAGGNGLLVYKPTSWTGVTGSQWGVGSADIQGVLRSSNTNLMHYRSGVGTSSTIWDSGNDGSGSGLDADLLDGQHASYFASLTYVDDKFVTKELFDKMFELDSNGYIKAKAGFYSTGFVSAYGANASASGSGGVDADYLQKNGYVTDEWVQAKLDALTIADIKDVPDYATEQWVENNFAKKGSVASSVAWADITGKPSWIGTTKPTYTYSEISGTPTIPTTTSQLTNNSGYITSSALADYLTVTKGDERYQPKGSYITSLSGYATQDWVLGKGYITSSSIPTSLKNPNALTFGSKTYDGSAAVTLTASDLGALTSHQSLANYVTLDGAQTITGQKIINTNTSTKPFVISRNNNTNESLSIGVEDTYTNIVNSQDEDVSAIRFTLRATDTETGGGTYASSRTFELVNRYSGLTATLGGSFTASSFIKSGGTSSQFLKADGSVDSTSYLPLTGGTMTGSVTFGRYNYIQKTGQNRSWINGRDTALARITSYSGYTAITSMKTTNGAWEMGVYDSDTMYFTYTPDSNYNASSNSGYFNIALPKKGGTIALTSDIPSVTSVAWDNVTGKPDLAYRATAQAFVAKQTFDQGISVSNGATINNLLTVASGSTHYGIKVGDSYINAINGSLIIQNNTAIRFGTSDGWNWDQWGGLKFQSNIIYLGIADGNVFSANTAQSGGYIYTPGIKSIYIGSTKSTELVLTSSNYSDYAQPKINTNQWLYTFNSTDCLPNTNNGNYVGMTTSSGIDTNWWHLLSLNWLEGATGGNKTWVSQLALPTQGRDTVYFRSGSSSSAYSSWIALATQSWVQNKLNSLGSAFNGGEITSYLYINNSGTHYYDGISLALRVNGNAYMGNKLYVYNDIECLNHIHSEDSISCDTTISAAEGMYVNGKAVLTASLTDLFRKMGYAGNFDSIGDNSNINGIYYINDSYSSWHSSWPFSYGSLVNFNYMESNWQLAACYTHELYYRNRWWSGNGNSWSSWKQIQMVSGSDIRMKNIHRYINPDINRISAASIIEFDWKEDGKTDMGCIAQDWQDIIPYAVGVNSANKMLTLDYGKAALISAVAIARKVVSHESRISQLERENEELKGIVRTLNEIINKNNLE